MRPLSLEEAFPEHLALAPVAGPVMSAWTGLLTSTPADAGVALADLLGLPSALGAQLTSRVERLALLAPRDPERRESLRLRSLAVVWRDGGFLLFRGNEHWLPFDWPPDFRTPLAHLGLVSFHGQDEIFVDAGPEATAIARLLTQADETPPSRLHPFYTDGHDRTSLWVGDDTGRSWVFERAARRLAPESEGGFPGWFALQLATSQTP